MRRSFHLLLLPFLLAAPSLAAGLPAAISGLAFSSDGGKVLVSMDTDGAPNAYALPVDGGAPVQLTRSAKDPVWTVSYFPADERVLYRSGPAGDEDHLFVRELNGKAVELAPGKTSRFVGWAGDGHGFWIEIANAGSQSRDLYKVATEGYARTLIDRNGSDVSRLAAVSPDGRFLAYGESNNDLVRDVRIRDRQTGQDQSLLAGEGFAVHIALGFSPDGTGLLTLNDVDNQFRGLARVEPATAASRSLLRESWDLLDARYSPDGKRIAVIAGGDTRSGVELYDAATLQPVALAELPGLGEVDEIAFSRDGQKLAVLGSGSALPPGVWVYDLARPGAPRRLIGGEIGGEPGGEAGGWVEGVVIPFKSFDEQMIPGILYKPRPGGLGERRQDAGGGLGPRRPQRAGAAGLRSAHPVPRAAGLRRLRGEPPGELRLRQGFRADGRPAARHRGPQGLRRRPGDPRLHPLGRPRPHRHRRRGARRLPDALGPRLPAPGIRRRDRPLRRRRLAAGPQRPPLPVGRAHDARRRDGARRRLGERLRQVPARPRGGYHRARSSSSRARATPWRSPPRRPGSSRR